MLTFYLPRPKSLPRWRWLPRSRPDASKLARAVEDSLTGVVYRDDGLITDLVVRKRFAIDEAPGVDIRIFPAGALERDAGRPGLLVALP